MTALISLLVTDKSPSTKTDIHFKTKLWDHFKDIIQDPFLADKGLDISTNSQCLLTAPEECFPQMKTFRTNPVPNITEGYSMAV